MLQDFRSSDVSTLRDVPSEDHGNALGLGELDEDARAFLDLGDAAGRGRYRCGLHRLNGVDDHEN